MNDAGIALCSRQRIAIGRQPHPKGLLCSLTHSVHACRSSRSGGHSKNNGFCGFIGSCQLIAVEHEHHLQGCMADTLVAINEEMVFDQGKAKNDSLLEVAINRRCSSRTSPRRR